MTLRESIDPGDTGHIGDHEALHAAYNDQAGVTGQALRLGPNALDWTFHSAAISDYVTDPAGDLDVRAKVLQPIYYSGWESGQAWVVPNVTFLVNHVDALGQNGWYLSFTGDGPRDESTLYLGLVSNNNGYGLGSTVPVPWKAGEPLWVRAVLDIDNGDSHWVVTYYTSENGTDWTQLGDPIVSDSGTWTWPDLNDEVPIMVSEPLGTFSGAPPTLVHRAEVRYGGALVANPHFDDPAEWTVGENGGDADTAADGQANTWLLDGACVIVEPPEQGAVLVYDYADRVWYPLPFGLAAVSVFASMVDQGLASWPE